MSRKFTTFKFVSIVIQSPKSPLKILIIFFFDFYGLACFKDLSGSQADRNRKKFIKIFKEDFGL